METNSNWLYDSVLTLGKLLGYIVIFIGVLMTFFLLETILFG